MYCILLIFNREFYVDEKIYVTKNIVQASQTYFCNNTIAQSVLFKIFI